MKRIPAAIIGLRGQGAEFLAAVRDNRRFELLAVADADAGLVRAAAEAGGAKGYTDYRSLVVEQAGEKLEALFVALEPFESVEYLTLAATHGINVFHQAPVGRNVEEASAAASAVARRDRLLTVGRYFSADPAYAELGEIETLIGRIHFATAEVQVAAQDLSGWRGDSVRAGGGVLIQGAYTAIDVLVGVLGLPDEVTACLSWRKSPSSARPYDTEDAAIVSMRFSDERIAQLSATRGGARDDWRVTFIGGQGSAEVSPDRLRIKEQGGVDRWSVIRASNRFAAQIDDFARALRDPDWPRRSTGDDHLDTIAVIEAAYLSAKTNTPESPSRFGR
ncbi:MAG: Gfo/Idh/MocA family oxidoreductase [Planctomycetes bacterium]|nr:Gfo/Idh/MocA family oxidoreductase [Planctomycetota bacterium]